MTITNIHSHPLILLTNDDGFYSEGIQVLKNKLKRKADVAIVAPDSEKSATSLALTLHHPLRVKKVDSNTYAVNGTPADCIYIAVQNILHQKPDLIISGMNPGPNLGQQDTSYSGTVAGALQGEHSWEYHRWPSRSFLIRMEIFLSNLQQNSYSPS